MKWGNIIIAGAVVLTVFLGVWFFFSTSGDSLPGETPTATSSPFGSGEVDGVSSRNPSFEGEVPLVGGDEETQSKLFKIAAAPVAGFVALNRPAVGASSSPTTIIRYTDRATGHIFDATMPIRGVGQLAKKRITNNTLPQIYEAIFRADGAAVLLRGLQEEGDTIENISLTLTPPTSTSTDALWSVSAASLRGQVDSPSAGTGNTLVYALRDTGAIMSSTFQGEGIKTLWSSGFTSWRTSKFGANTLVFTKPSAAVPGYAYSVSSAGALTKLLGPLNALSAVGNSAGTRLFYSYISGPYKMAVYNVTQETSEEISPATIPEKCVWSTKDAESFFCGTPSEGLSGTQPDDWYAGKTHFSDYIWQFNAATQTSSLIMQPKANFDVDLDVYNPALSLDESYLIFMNKTDLSLWAVYLR